MTVYAYIMHFLTYTQNGPHLYIKKFDFCVATFKIGYLW